MVKSSAKVAMDRKPVGAVTRLVLALALAGTALAQEADVDQQARDYFDRGTAAFDQGRYVEALAAFSAGYELSQKPAFLYNMAECARLIGDRGRAYDLYRRFLDATPDTRRRKEVEKWIAELKPPESAQPPSPEPPKADEPMQPFRLSLGRPALIEEKPAPPSADLSHAGQVGIVVRGELSARTGEGGPSVGITMGFGRHVEASVVGIITDPLGLRAAAAWLFRPTAALKPFGALGVPLFFSDDGTIVAAHAGAGLLWDLHRGLGLFAEVSGEYFPDPPGDLNKAVLLLSAGAQARAF